MTLLEAHVGKTYMVLDVAMEKNTETRLEVLGLTGGTRIQILNRKKSGALILKVRGTRLALGKSITGHIQVEEASYTHTQKDVPTQSPSLS